MPSSLIIESFAPPNIRERSQLLEPADTGATALWVVSTAGYGINDIFYVGSLGMERCERAVVASVQSSTQLTLVGPLPHSHTAYSNVTSVLGDSIRINRALGTDGNVPADEDFVPLGTREILVQRRKKVQAAACYASKTMMSLRRGEAQKAWKRFRQRYPSSARGLETRAGKPCALQIPK